MKSLGASPTVAGIVGKLCSFASQFDSILKQKEQEGFIAVFNAIIPVSAFMKVFYEFLIKINNCKQIIGNNKSLQI